MYVCSRRYKVYVLTKILLTFKCICAQEDFTNFKILNVYVLKKIIPFTRSFWVSQPWELIRRQEEEDVGHINSGPDQNSEAYEQGRQIMVFQNLNKTEKYH